MHRSLARTAAALLVSAGGLAAAASAASAAPAVTASPTVNLTPAGKTVAVTGSEIPLTTGTPAGTGLYAAQLAIVDGTTYYANNATAKWVRQNPTAGSAGQAKLEDDGSYATSVTAVRSWTSGATTIDCMAADTECFIASWPAHGNPTAASVIDAAPIAFADIAATPVTDLDPAGATVAVTGANLALTTGTPAGTGLYAAQIAIVDGGTFFANNATAKWVRQNPTAGSAGQAKLEDDGSFSTSVDVVKSWGSGASAVDCTAADTACFVASWPAHGNPTAENVIDSVALQFAGAPDPGPGPGPGPGGFFGLAVWPTAGLGTDGPSVVTVSGAGYAASEPGIYLVYGPRAGRTDPGAYYGSTRWLHVAGGNLSATGTFTTTLAVAPTYTDANGNVVNCTVVQCYVQTMRAHGMTDVDQDFAVPVSFGATVATPASETGAAAAPTPQTPDSTAPAAPASAGSAGPNAAPALGRLSVGRGGRASLRVSERSTVTFVLRKKAGARWKVVKVVRVRAPGAGTISTRLPIGSAGRYRISIKAVSSETGKASRKIVKRLTVKAKKARRG